MIEMILFMFMTIVLFVVFFRMETFCYLLPEDLETLPPDDLVVVPEDLETLPPDGLYEEELRDGVKVCLLVEVLLLWNVPLVFELFLEDGVKLLFVVLPVEDVRV